MGHLNRSFDARRLTFLILASVLAAGTRAGAQTENNFPRLACPEPSCATATTALEERNCGEPPLGNNLVTVCDFKAGVELAPIEAAAPRNDRLFYMLPNYLTGEDAEKYEPLSTATKFKYSARTMSDPVTISFLGVIALIGQARDTYPSYGQGFQGYGKRYVTVFANTGIGTLMTASVLPTVLHQDPRYFRLGTGGIRRRMMNSGKGIFITRSDAGERQFNYSEIVGNGIAAGISNTYLPQSQRTVGNTFSVWGSDIVLNTLCNMAKEFWPDLRRKIHNLKHPE